MRAWPRASSSPGRARAATSSRRSALRWAAVEATQGAWRPTNPWHRLYVDVKSRNAGKANPAKAAVARKVLIASWHVLSRQEPFKPSRPGRTNPVPAISPSFLAA
jgi:hypothetical protein